MKNKILPLAIATIAAGSLSPLAMADVTVYGKANVSLNQTELESDGVDQGELNSNASRLGVKGSVDISEGLKAIYGMEFEVFVDDGDDGDGETFAQRNIYGGFQGGFGTIIAGKHDTPSKLAQGKVDRFNDLQHADMKEYVEGENRADNIVMYTTPSFGGFAITGASVQGEEDTYSGSDSSDGVSLAATWSNDMIYAALAADDSIDNQDLIRAVLDIKLGIFTIGGMVQQAENTYISSIDEDSYLLSGEVKLGEKVVLKAQYGMTDYSNDDEDMQTAVGADYLLNDNSKLYAYYSIIEREEAGGETADDSTMGVGYEIKF